MSEQKFFKSAFAKCNSRWKELKNKRIFSVKLKVFSLTKSWIACRKGWLYPALFSKTRELPQNIYVEKIGKYLSLGTAESCQYQFYMKA